MDCGVLGEARAELICSGEAAAAVGVPLVLPSISASSFLVLVASVSLVACLEVRVFFFQASSLASRSACLSLGV